MFKYLARKYTLPGIKRWVGFAVLGLIVISLGIALVLKAHPVTMMANFLWDFLSLIADVVPPTMSGIIAIGLGVFFLLYAFFSANKHLLGVIAPDESSLFETLDRHYMEGKGIKIVAIGGGTGLSNMLRGLKHFTSNITAVVTVADDGGSSGRLRKEMDIVPPGDIRNCIAALSADDEVITQLFQYRFEKHMSSDLGGHSFGNLFLTALVELDDSRNMADAVQNACSILKTRGKVFPVSNDPMQLVAEMESGEIVKGESNIPEAEGKIKKLYCESPSPTVLPEVIEAINEADLIIMGPGSLYTSIIPNLLIPDLVNAVTASKAIKVYVCNVMTQPGETDEFSVGDHLETLLKHASLSVNGFDSEDISSEIKEKLVDVVVANNGSPDKKQLDKYRAEKQYPVSIDFERAQGLGSEIHTSNLLQNSDLVRHNFRKLAKAIMTIYLRTESPNIKRPKENTELIKEAIKAY